MAQIIWRIEWPEEVRCRLVTFANPTGDITNLDLKMAAEVLGWLVLEGVVPTRWIRVGVCIVNSVTVGWKTRECHKYQEWQTELCAS